MTVDQSDETVVSFNGPDHDELAKEFDHLTVYRAFLPNKSQAEWGYLSTAETPEEFEKLFSRVQPETCGYAQQGLSVSAIISQALEDDVVPVID